MGKKPEIKSFWDTIKEGAAHEIGKYAVGVVIVFCVFMYQLDKRLDRLDNGQRAIIDTIKIVSDKKLDKFNFSVWQGNYEIDKALMHKYMEATDQAIEELKGLHPRTRGGTQKDSGNTSFFIRHQAIYGMMPGKYTTDER